MSTTTPRVVFHEKLKSVRERFGHDIRLEGLAGARRADVPVKRRHHVFATMMLATFGIALVIGLVALAIVLDGATTAQAQQLSQRGLGGWVVSPNGMSRLGGWIVAGSVLVLGIGSLIFAHPVTMGRDIYDRTVRLFSPPFTRRPYALYLRRAQKTDAPGSLDLSVASEAKFIHSFARVGAAVCVGINRVPAEDPPGTARIRVKDDEAVWRETVDLLDQDAAFVTVDVTDASERTLWQVRRMANGENVPRFGMLIALGTPERRMESWRRVAEAIAGTTAQVSPVAPKAPPCVMLIDGTIWTALGQAPHALGAAQLGMAIEDRQTQGLFDVAAGI